MTDAQQALGYAEGFLTALAAVLQDREWVDGKVGNITATTAEVKKLLRSVATHTGCDENELRGLREENKRLTAMIEEMRSASERTDPIAKWIDRGGIPTGNPGEYVASWECINCGKIVTEKTAYCPGCGARMEVDTNE
jgi:rubrerythrin